MTGNGKATGEMVPAFLTMGTTDRGGKGKITSKRVKSIGLIASLVAAFALTHNMSPAIAAPGDLLATVTLPGNGDSVGGSTIPGGPAGIVYIAPRAFVTGTWDIYLPPPGPGTQVAALLATKTFVDGDGNPVAVSCGTWDPERNVLWVANTGIPGPVYSVDLGDLTASGTALATLEFNSNIGGAPLCDGIAYDEGSDTLWISPDVDTFVYEYDLIGTRLRAVAPLNAAGQRDGRVSGVTIGSDNTLYIGRNGAQEIRRINKDTGAFISNFAQTVGRAEDLSCDPVTYNPIEAIISKDASGGFYEAFEAEEGTCPLPGGPEVMIDISFLSNPNAFNCKRKGEIPVTIFGMENFDVTEIVIGNLRLALESDPEGAHVTPPKSWSFADRGDPETDKGASQGAIVDDVEQDFLNPDDFPDLDVAFDSQAVADLIGCDALQKGDVSATLVVLEDDPDDGFLWQSVPVGDPGIDQLVIESK